MGWRGTLRSINAANRKIGRETERQNRAVNRVADGALRQANKDRARVERQAQELENDLATDPIAALSLRYTPATGFVAEPFQVSTEVVKGTIALLTPSPNHQPSSLAWDGDGFSLSILDVLVTQFATFVAVRIENLDAAYRIKPIFIKKTDRASSPAFIVANGDYYYPLSTDLKGDVVPGAPRVGTIAFEPFRSATDYLDLHFSELKLRAEKGARDSHLFRFTPPDLRSSIESARMMPSVTEQVRAQLNAAIASASSNIEAARSGALRGSNSGCLTVLALLFFIVMLVMVVRAFLLGAGA